MDEEMRMKGDGKEEEETKENEWNKNSKMKTTLVSPILKLSLRWLANYFPFQIIIDLSQALSCDWCLPENCSLKKGNGSISPRHIIYRSRRCFWLKGLSCVTKASIQFYTLRPEASSLKRDNALFWLLI